MAALRSLCLFQVSSEISTTRSHAALCTLRGIIEYYLTGCRYKGSTVANVVGIQAEMEVNMLLHGIYDTAEVFFCRNLTIKQLMISSVCFVSTLLIWHSVLYCAPKWSSPVEHVQDTACCLFQQDATKG